jgi:hypothetical protein
VAELTNLETKLGEVIGLAMAAQGATKKVSKLVEQEKRGDALLAKLRTMSEEASQAEERGSEVAGQFTGKKAAIMKEARTVKNKAADMMSTYLDKDADALDGFEFLTMAEASEVGHWSVLRKLNQKARIPAVRELAEWQIPIQKRHFRDTMDGAMTLAAQEDPNEVS